MFSMEHGTGRDDELNRVLRGKNYGWLPGPGYDEGRPMTDLSRFPGAVTATWSSGDPTIATSGIDFLEGAQWGPWNGAIFAGALAGEQARVFTVSANGALTGQVTPSDLDNTFGRLRTPVQGPDGALYLTTANGGGNDQILRITIAP
jgi:glucose/arabinose dehydrogenase